MQDDMIVELTGWYRHCRETDKLAHPKNGLNLPIKHLPSDYMMNDLRLMIDAYTWFWSSSISPTFFSNRGHGWSGWIQQIVAIIWSLTPTSDSCFLCSNCCLFSFPSPLHVPYPRILCRDTTKSKDSLANSDVRAVCIDRMLLTRKTFSCTK